MLEVGAAAPGRSREDGRRHAGALARLRLDAADVTVLDPQLPSERREALSDPGGDRRRVPEAAGRAYKTIVLAVKPQSMQAALAEVSPLAAPDTAIISIAAGVSNT